MGLGGVTVTLSGMGDAKATTDDSGGYEFRGLRAGTYSVEISSFDSNEVSFSSTSAAATVGVGETKVIPNFDGTYVRTAGILGQVTVEGVGGLPGVTVTLVGEGEDETEVTNASGQYAFSNLKSGTYQVAITNPDPDDYEFTTTSKSATVGTGETVSVPFEGTLLRTAGIAGRVSVGDMGLNDVTVNLAGTEERKTTTANGGQYAFAGLAAGAYVLSITNPDPVKYDFPEDQLQQTVMLEDDQALPVNFEGTHTRTASISGVLFIDEVMDDKKRNDGEPTITEALGPWLLSLADDDPTKMAVTALLGSAKVTVRGPDLNDVEMYPINPLTGTFLADSLMAGSYQVELPANDDEVAKALDLAGVAFVGESMVVTVEAGASETADFPFRIKTQTITVGAVMGNDKEVRDPVNGVMLSLYPTAEDAEDGTNMLGEAMATAGEGLAAGMAKFDFPRAMDSRPGSDDTDNLVFVKVDDTGSEELVVTDNNVIEIEYPGVARAHAAPAHVRLLNSQVNIQFWIKSDEDAKDGNMGLEDWAYEYCMPMADDPATMDVDEENTCMDAEDAPAVFTPAMDADGDAMLTDAEGKGTLSFMADTDNLPAMVYIRAAADQDDEIDMDEEYEQTAALMHSHDGFILPANNDPAKNMELDKGPVYVSFTTQTLHIGVHRELDDETGYTNRRGIGGGDARPKGDAVGKITVRLMEEDDRGRLRAYEYDHDADDETDPKEAEEAVDASGMVKFEHVPAGDDITVVATAGSGMTIIPDDRDWRMVDAYTDAGYPDAFDDGVILGGFGKGEGGGGARPDVWLCPLTVQPDADAEDDCSTFAYKWKDGAISGSIAGLRKGDKDVEVTLTPENSNDEYSSDLEDDKEVAFGAAGFEFSSVADGEYKVKLEGVAGKWKADSVVVEVLHDELDRNERGAADVAIASGALSATQLRLAIQGVVANDRNEDGHVSSTEAEVGVELQLFKASVPRSGANAGKAFKSGGAIDETTTDRDGIYAFRELVEGQKYIVEAVNVPGSYKAVRKRGDLAVEADDFGMVSQAYVEKASDFDPDFDGGTPPTWDHARDVMHNAGTTNFALLWDNGTVFGKVSDPSVRAAHEDAGIELYRCLTDGDYDALDLNGDGDEDDTGEPAFTDDDAYECASEPEGRRAAYATATPNTKGNWEIEGELLEGNYEVVVRLPRSYGHATEDGDATGTEGSEGYYETQIVTLNTGRRSEDGSETFHIVLDDADNTDPSTAPTAVIKDGSRTVTADADDDYVAYTTSSVTVILSHGSGVDEGTTYKVVYSATNKVPLKVGTPGGTWRGLTAGENSLSVDATAESGYATANFPEVRTLHRDTDTRLKVLTIDIPGAGNDITLDRDALEAISGFPASEGRRTDELDPSNTSGGTTVVDLGRVASFKRPATGSTTEVTVEASAFGSGVTLSGADAQDLTAGSGNQTLTFTITLTDDGRTGDDGNTRSYRFTVRGTP